MHARGHSVEVRAEADHQRVADRNDGDARCGRNSYGLEAALREAVRSEEAMANRPTRPSIELPQPVLRPPPVMRAPPTAIETGRSVKMRRKRSARAVLSSVRFAIGWQLAPSHSRRHGERQQPSQCEHHDDAGQVQQRLEDEAR